MRDASWISGLPSEADLQELAQAALASTPGALRWGQDTYATEDDAVAAFRSCLAKAPALDLNSVFLDRPEDLLIVAVTGNGPTSAANARFFCGARAAVLGLVGTVRTLQAQAAVMRAALVQAHLCPTLKADGTCGGCSVSEALASDAGRALLAEVTARRQAAKVNGHDPTCARVRFIPGCDVYQRCDCSGGQ